MCYSYSEKVYMQAYPKSGGNAHNFLIANFVLANLGLLHTFHVQKSWHYLAFQMDLPFDLTLLVLQKANLGLYPACIFTISLASWGNPQDSWTTFWTSRQALCLIIFMSRLSGFTASFCITISTRSHKHEDLVFSTM